MGDIAIRADSLCKQYRIGSKRSGYRTLRDTLSDGFVAPFRRVSRLFSGQPYGAADMHESIWALKDVSFEIKRGEVVGIIGSNGAGKTTLLKILSRITEPSEGYAEIYGRVGSLLEVGTGFHPELTGRENIYLNGAILGMKKAEIVNKFETIMDFAQIEKFIDTPVKHYSSGMYVRLAFAVAAHLEPEILLVDEVLAVGDAAFQKKCLGKMEEVATEGRTVLFVSHNMSAIASFCNRAVLLVDGAVQRHGEATSVIQAYLSKSSNDKMRQGETVFPEESFDPETPFQLVSLRTLDKNEQVRADFTNSEPIIVELEFFLKEQIQYLMIGFELKNALETVILRSFHNDLREVLTYRSDSTYRYRLRSVIPARMLNGGLFSIEPCVGIHRKTWFIRDLKALSINVIFDVPNPDYVYGASRPGCISPILEWHDVSERE
jgi:lipopolysaccharide transport system ATP-binding protein